MDFDNLVLQETPDANIVTTPGGQVVHWNKGAEIVFGYTRAEAIGHALADMVAPENHRERARHALRTTLENGFHNYETLCRKKDGTRVHVNVSSKAIYGPRGEVEFILLSEKDVTQLKALRESEERLRVLVESVQDYAIFMLDPSGHVISWNIGAERINGYKAEEILGKHFSVFYPPEDIETGRPGCALLVAQTERRFEDEGWRIRKDGTRFWASIAITALLDEAGMLRGFAKVSRDISERKRIECALNERNIELEKENLAKDCFLASMSHELRTSLNAIIGFTGTLLMKLPGPLTSDQEKQLRTIQFSARHLLSLINDMLDLAKIESGKIQLHYEPVVCQSVIDEVAEILAPLAMQKRLAFNVELPEQDVALRTDRRALRQILLNLVNNAIKFTEKGSVSIRLARHESDGQSLVKISVVDTGVGIKPEDQARLFQAFRQLASSPARCFEGTGLGLYLSQKLSHLLGGRISFKSKDGEGSSFSLMLKIARQ